MQDKIPKVFISYSWSSGEKVQLLAERLMSHGIEVVLDKWDLKEGQDKYAFMEQCVSNPEIDRVLIVCDKAYSEKANSRSGGVGDETAIISPQIYGQMKQEKFIPVIFELDEDGNPYCPTYIQSRIFIDLSGDDEKYETNYEQLIRNIYEKPLYKKPALGKIPDWIDNETVNIFPLRDLLKQMKVCTNDIKADTLNRHFLDNYIQLLKEYKIENESFNPDIVLTKIEEMKIIRDLYLDYLDILATTNVSLSAVLSDFFEELYNSVLDVSLLNKRQYSKNQFEHYRFFIWESFICTTAFLLHFEKFLDLRNFLCRTYFLRDSYYENSNIVASNYTVFREYFEIIERDCKPKIQKNLYTLSGKILCERERKPIYSKKNLANADVFLYQIFPILKLNSHGHPYWFPTSYIYQEDIRSQWIKLTSRKYCEKVFPLFNVNSIKELKQLISLETYNKEMGYNGSFSAAPVILTSIKVDDIGSLY